MGQSAPFLLASESDRERDHVCVPGRNCWCIARAARMTVLVDADAYFGAFAKAVARAQESIFVIGWDIQAATRLLPGPMPHGRPNTLREYLDATLTARPGLNAYLLDWDFSLVFALEREVLPVVQLGWLSHPRLHFSLDGAHPLAGCHHQKIVVVDDAVAFVGGLDLTTSRWDTPAHGADDPSRTLPNGKLYPPFHDVQMMVSGDVARHLATLARRRWEQATGQRVRPATVRSDPWPPDVAPDLRDVDVAITRTEPAFEGRPQVTAVETLYLDSIAAARRCIYIENQYFTYGRLADSMASRLAEPDGPEIVLVVPRICSGWLEERTMGVGRARLLHQLRAADRHDHFRVYHPRLPGSGDTCPDLNVHAKVMIVDDVLARVGSSNLSNRSMGLDTECDLAIEARGDARVARGVAALRERLLGEHLDVPPREVRAALERAGSLIRAVETLEGRERTLVPLTDDVTESQGLALTDIAPIDLERPVAHAPFVAWLVPPRLREPLVRGVLRGARALAGVLATTLVWRLVGLGAFLAHAPALHVGVALAVIYLLGSVLQVPIAALHTVTVLSLGPWRGFYDAVAASTVTDVLAFGVAWVLPRARAARLAGRHLSPLARLLVRGRARDVAMVRLTGLAPFPTVAVVAGASSVPLWKFLGGTLAVTIPSVAAVASITWLLGG